MTQDVSNLPKTLVDTSKKNKIVKVEVELLGQQICNSQPPINKVLLSNAKGSDVLIELFDMEGFPLPLNKLRKDKDFTNAVNEIKESRKLELTRIFTEIELGIRLMKAFKMVHNTIDGSDPPFDELKSVVENIAKTFSPKLIELLVRTQKKNIQTQKIYLELEKLIRNIKSLKRLSRKLDEVIFNSIKEEYKLQNNKEILERIGQYRKISYIVIEESTDIIPLVEISFKEAPYSLTSGIIEEVKTINFSENKVSVMLHKNLWRTIPKMDYFIKENYENKNNIEKENG
ncbi:hypothetical protein ACFLY9_02175 [Patescibacteria group bacterium]